MKKAFFSVSVLALLSLFAACKKTEVAPLDDASIKAPTLASARTNTTKASILSYIAGMKNNWQVISGQECGDGDDISWGYGTFIDGLYNLTGKYPAICGADYGYKSNNLTTINNKLLAHWNAGGLVEINWSADNPWVDGYSCRWNSVSNKNSINLNALLKNAAGSTAKTNYRNELANVANALKALKNANVIVLWRPFHEMNADYFWWGMNEYNGNQTNTQAYKNLWIDLYNTLTNDYGLNNLIWVYSAEQKYSWNSSVTAYYPGSSYVDIVGEDVYSATPGFVDYNELAALGKPCVLTECGPNSTAYGNYDERTLIDNIKGKACYFLQWHSWSGAAVAIKDNKRYMEMIWGGDVITRDEVQ